jgi:hypothetical protein
MRRLGKNAATHAYTQLGSFTIGSEKKDTSLLPLSLKIGNTLNLKKADSG